MEGISDVVVALDMVGTMEGISDVVAPGVEGPIGLEEAGANVVGRTGSCKTGLIVGGPEEATRMGAVVPGLVVGIFVGAAGAAAIPTWIGIAVGVPVVGGPVAIVGATGATGAGVPATGAGAVGVVPIAVKVHESGQLVACRQSQMIGMITSEVVKPGRVKSAEQLEEEHAMASPFTKEGTHAFTIQSW
jgi:hypothetical protein